MFSNFYLKYIFNQKSHQGVNFLSYCKYGCILHVYASSLGKRGIMRVLYFKKCTEAEQSVNF